ncbi:hypothetical protein CW304_28030 [Bacillus sp. UFRGS-B20]|nr:hypothetical protein CW304_28030 [Bacillus sp. UFRGS-B20]
MRNRTEQKVREQAQGIKIREEKGFIKGTTFMGQVRGGDPQKQLLLSNVQMLFRILIKKVAEKKA